ncbi:unnamed protein product [Notodromas monacha]|uniref:Protein quiver n=1 Tax=Notodromas monacha TaxID=399045 RepID=A0A7R9BXE1_9CRUS|nr:unnamed protein product [Notodromas monacha]CAG0921988.1 unnamed protein product [Notodromas monacha]
MGKTLQWCIMFFFVFSTTAEAIKCYVCKSSKSNMCNDPFDKTRARKDNLLKECSYDLLASEATGTIPRENVTFFCRKGYQMVHGKEHIYRSCGWEPYYVEGRDCYFTAVENVKSTTCECHENGCNDSETKSVTMSALIVSAMLVILLIPRLLRSSLNNCC